LNGKGVAFDVPERKVAILLSIGPFDIGSDHQHHSFLVMLSSKNKAMSESLLAQQSNETT
jgi:hypothetical protein